MEVKASVQLTALVVWYLCYNILSFLLLLLFHLLFIFDYNEMNDAEGLCTAEGAGDLLVPIFAKSLHAESLRFISSAGPLTARLQPLQYL